MSRTARAALGTAGFLKGLSQGMLAQGLVTEALLKAGLDPNGRTFRAALCLLLAASWLDAAPPRHLWKRDRRHGTKPS